MYAERIKIDCTKEKNALYFENPLLTGILKMSPNISAIPKIKLSVLENIE